MRSFRISISDGIIDDLRERLLHARLLADSPRRPQSGLSAAYLRELVEAWAVFDWRARERWLNEHPQFIAEVEGTDIHFVHLRSERADAPVLLVMHGWPHTFALQLEFARLLPDFHVVVPSLPGFAFSAAYDGTMSEGVMARLMHSLMSDTLGYERYLTYGEDLSANVSDLIAATYPESVQGIFATHAHFGTDEERAHAEDPAARAFFARLAASGGPDGAYGHVQGTRPDTLAAALNDSPAGLIAWITEKLVEWSDTPTARPELLERRISRDRILTEAMIYWSTQSIATSFRSYFDGGEYERIPPVEVPAAVAIQRHEYDYPESVAWAYYRDLRSFGRMPEGGHFAIAEVPEAMATRMREFASGLGLL
ncbi:epoxide hydrolase family protein [Microbacterium sp. A82]|uniref:epoxide hydrolase family protein n=1 Tax=unclassified Microbacterium TaxID=2609290 RepID=UPI003F40B432